MQQYVFWNDLRQWAYEHNLVTNDTLYCVLPDIRIYIRINELVREDPVGSTPVTFPELTPEEQECVLNQLQQLLGQFAQLRRRNSVCIHPDDIEEFFRNNNVVDFKILQVPGRTNVYLFYK